MTAPSPRLRALAAVGALAGWGALILKLVVAMQMANEDGRGTDVAVVSYFAAFSIWANILAAVALTSCAAPDFAPGKIFSKPAALSGVAAVMLSVGLVYSLLLRATWNPQGLQWIADEGFHDVMPALVLIYWWLAVPRNTLQWRDITGWLLYPIAYFAFLILRGEIGGVYAYRFMDVGFIGYGRALLNACGALLAFAAVGAALVVAKGMPRGSAPADARVETV